MVINIHIHNIAFGPDLVLSCIFKDITVAPPIPAIQGTAQLSKRTQESLKDVIAGAAVTFVNAMCSPDYSTSSVKAQNLLLILKFHLRKIIKATRVLVYHLVELQIFE